MVRVVVCKHMVAAVMETVEVEGVLHKVVVVEEVVLYKVVVMAAVVSALGEEESILGVAAAAKSKCMQVVEVVNAVVEEANWEVAVNYSSKGQVGEERTKVEVVVENLAVEAAVSAHSKVE